MKVKYWFFDIDSFFSGKAIASRLRFHFSNFRLPLKFRLKVRRQWLYTLTAEQFRFKYIWGQYPHHSAVGDLLFPRGLFNHPFPCQISKAFALTVSKASAICEKADRHRYLDYTALIIRYWSLLSHDVSGTHTHKKRFWSQLTTIFFDARRHQRALPSVDKCNGQVFFQPVEITASPSLFQGIEHGNPSFKM